MVQKIGVQVDRLYLNLDILPISRKVVVIFLITQNVAVGANSPKLLFSQILLKCSLLGPKRKVLIATSPKNVGS